MIQLIACSETGLDRAEIQGDNLDPAHALAKRLGRRVGVYQVAHGQWSLMRYVEPPPRLTPPSRAPRRA